jgi:hypothetical protein
METEISPVSSQPPAPPDATRGDCVAAADTYAWSYENFKTSSGTGGVACNAQFTIRSTGAEPLYVLVFSAWDNNAMQDRRWETLQLQPGDQKEVHVSRTIYTDGVVTYSQVERVLAIRDAPECAGLLSTESQPTWEAQALNIDPLACP